MRKSNSLPEKANKILNGTLVVLILVAIRIWQLAVVQHDKKVEESKRPQRRTVLERSERASIYDRFGVPLAINKVQYNAAISYGPIRDLPRWVWKEDETGRRVKFFERNGYITTLASHLGEELNLEPQWLEDLIHSKAAILGNVPCVIKENISEEQYFRLKMMAKDWPGVHAEVAAKRCYPLGNVGGEVVGYIGPISRREYDAVTEEMGALRETLASYEEGEQQLDLGEYHSIDQVRERLEELEKKAYRINDSVGKMGVEAAYDENLRGLCGKHVYLSDIRGNFLRELPGSENPIPGNRLILSLSSELQAFCQQLLAEYDTEPFSNQPSALKRRALIPENQPWIKGGAIVALDPKTGEVYALASFPGFDPNDFIRPENDPEAVQKNKNVNQWLETESYLGRVWDMKIAYSRPRFVKDQYSVDSIEMGWDAFLSFILPHHSPVREMMERKNHLKEALELQKRVDHLLAQFQEGTFQLTAPQIFDWVYSGSHNEPIGCVITLKQKEFLKERFETVKEEVDHLKNELAPYFSTLSMNYEKLLLTDLYRLAVNGAAFHPQLADLLGEMTLSEYREAAARLSSVSESIKRLTREIYLENDFKRWREAHFKEHLAEKRAEEKAANKKYARPFIEYLEMVQKERFNAFWQQNQWPLIALLLKGEKGGEDPYSSALAYWKKEIESGAHQGLDWVYHYHLLRAITDPLDKRLVIPFLMTLRTFDQLDRPLLGKYSGLRGHLERDLAAAFYPPTGMGFSRSHAYRQATTIGSIFKIVPAYAVLKQRYLTLKEQGEALSTLNPLTIVDDKRKIPGNGDLWNVGFTLDGKVIPMFYRGGRLPRTDHSGVGEVDLIKAIAASSNPYFALLSGDILDDPEDLCKAANELGFGEKTGIDLPGEYAGRLPLDISYNRTGLYSLSIGQHSLVGTPLQTAIMLAAVVNGGGILTPHVVKAQLAADNIHFTKPEIRRKVFLPSQIQEMLLTGMKQVIWGEKGTARQLIREYPSELMRQIIGKTSTSEVIEWMGLDGLNGRMKLKHVWFGAVSYETADLQLPELVVVVYLRYGEWGRDAAPLAVEVIKKWREIKKRSI